MPARPSLRDQLRQARDLAHVVVHWTGDHPKVVDAAALTSAVSGVERSTVAEAVLPDGVVATPGATIGRFVARQRLTTTGGELADAWTIAIKSWNTRMKNGV